MDSNCCPLQVGLRSLCSLDVREQRLTGWELVMKGQWTESGGGSEALALK